uniref:Uncharacterized protein n=1 Tax=Physcomitrium patens TaxID=3218 RepID=A0A2K1IB96_PHYPA|nr:hypothetical protein PHYPA_030042 [Physcomitrium patens]
MYSSIATAIAIACSSTLPCARKRQVQGQAHGATPLHHPQNRWGGA